jgi:hypothetical protein
VQKFIKENIVLVLGISLPLLLVGFFILASVLPAMFVENPRYDFLFSDGAYSQMKFEVVNGKLHIKVTANQYGDRTTPTLYRYSATTGKVQKFSIQLPEIPAIAATVTNNSSINTNIVIPVDPTKPPSPEQAQNAAKIVAEIKKDSTPQTVMIAVTELADLKLDSGTEAPDGYRFIQGGYDYYRSDFFWGLGSSGSNRRTAMIKNGKSVPIVYNNTHENYYNSPQFIGWIIP